MTVLSLSFATNRMLDSEWLMMNSTAFSPRESYKGTQYMACRLHACIGELLSLRDMYQSRACNDNLSHVLSGILMIHHHPRYFKRAHV